MDYSYYAANSHGMTAYFFYETQHLDAAIRYAVSGDDPEKFRELITEAYNPVKCVHSIHTLCLLLILIKAGKEDFTRIFQEQLAEREASYQPFRDFGDSVSTTEILRALSFMSDDFYDTPTPLTPGSCTLNSSHINTPLYYAIINGRTGLFEKYIDSAFAFGSEDDLTGYMLSAMYFRDTDFLNAAFKKGVLFNTEMAAAFCTDTETIKYLRDNFPEYVFPGMTENDDPVRSTSDFIRLAVKNEDTIGFIRAVIHCHGRTKYEQISDKIPKISAIKTSDIDDMAYSFFSPNEDIHYLGGAVREALNDSITVIADSNCLPLNRILDEVCIDVSGIDVTYDISKSDANVFLTSNMTSVRKFLKENKIIFPTGELSPTISGLLGYNNVTITKLLIENSAVTEENINEVIDYLSERKLFNSLNIINKFYSDVQCRII